MYKMHETKNDIRKARIQIGAKVSVLESVISSVANDEEEQSLESLSKMNGILDEMLNTLLGDKGTTTPKMKISNQQHKKLASTYIASGYTALGKNHFSAIEDHSVYVRGAADRLIYARILPFIDEHEVVILRQKILSFFVDDRRCVSTIFLNDNDRAIKAFIDMVIDHAEGRGEGANNLREQRLIELWDIIVEYADMKWFDYYLEKYGKLVKSEKALSMCLMHKEPSQQKFDRMWEWVVELHSDMIEPMVKEFFQGQIYLQDPKITYKWCKLKLNEATYFIKTVNEFLKTSPSRFHTLFSNVKFWKMVLENVKGLTSETAFFEEMAVEHGHELQNGVAVLWIKHVPDMSQEAKDKILDEKSVKRILKEKGLTAKKYLDQLGEVPDEDISLVPYAVGIVLKSTKATPIKLLDSLPTWAKPYALEKMEL